MKRSIFKTNKNFLQEIANETFEISKNRTYSTNKTILNIPEQEPSKLFKNEDFKSLNILSNIFNNTKIELLNEGSVSAIFRVSKLTTNKIGILNFASAYNAGGGFLKGIMAQEEALAYTSDLYYKQIEKEAYEYYNINKSYKSKMYTNTMIASPVTFFRDENFNFVNNPVVATVITSPAINVTAMIRNKESLKMSRVVMESRMQKILDLFTYLNCSHIILGAFGCGGFGNDPYEIATIWKKLLYDKGYINHFEYISFSIKSIRNDDNLNAFKDVFINI